MVIGEQGTLLHKAVFTAYEENGWLEFRTM